MKAFRITSSVYEYQENLLEEFLFIDGKYIGCLSHPSRIRFPKSIDAWRKHMLYYYNVDEVSVTKEQLAELADMQSEIDALKSQRKEYSFYELHSTDEQKEMVDRKNIETRKFNLPIEEKIEEIWWKMRKIIRELPDYEQ